jgi:hypothetical protein
MRRPIYLWVFVGLLVSGARAWAEESQEQAVTALKRDGVEIDVDEADPARPVVRVVFGSEAAATDTDLAHLKAFRQLQSLVVLSSKVTDAGLLHVKGLVHLNSIYFGLCDITDKGLEPLKGLTNLEEVTFRNTKVTEAGTLEFQMSLPKVAARLQEQALLAFKKKRAKIEMDEKNQVIGIFFGCFSECATDADLARLRYFPHLQKLDIGPDLTDDGMVQLKGLADLRQISIWGAPITDKGLEPLKGLTKLERVSFFNTTVTKEDIADLQKALPKAKVVKPR